MMESRGAKITVKCKVCGDKFEARVADRKRGWAKCCSKSCAAKKSNRETGKYIKHGFNTGYYENENDWDGVNSVHDDPFYTGSDHD